MSRSSIRVGLLALSLSVLGSVAGAAPYTISKTDGGNWQTLYAGVQLEPWRHPRSRLSKRDFGLFEHSSSFLNPERRTLLRIFDWQ